MEKAPTYDTDVIKHRISEYDDDDDLPDEYQVLGEEPVTLDTGFSNFIVVDNLPIVGPEKYKKLLGVINKIYSQIGEIVEIELPMEGNQTKGFAFVEFTTSYAAANAVKQTNGYKLDKSHIFRVNFFDDFAIYDRVSDEQPVDELSPYKPKENLQWWLIELKGRAREQFVLRYMDWTEMYWLDGQKKTPLQIHKQKQMTETYVTWSPYGTYLGTLHAQGIILWGGPKWEKIVKFVHPGVKLLDFSPRENYLVTVSPQFQHDDNEKDPQCIIVWDVRSAAKKRGFTASKEKEAWPIFKWSHDEKYFARLTQDAISVFESSTMQLLGKKSLKIPGVKDFCWSPSDHILACSVPETGPAPAKVMLIDIPSRKIRRSHNLFKVQECNMHWHPSGDYLCVKVDRLLAKKTVVTNFELFRMREKDVPMETLEMREKIIAFAWEPKGQHFAVIHSNQSLKHSVSFYSMAGRQFELKRTLEKRSANLLFWSPRGHHIVIAGFANLGGTLEFFNVDNLETMRADTHFSMTDLMWDPSGRFVATSTSYWGQKLDNGYTIWTFQGQQLFHVTKDKFYQLLWRPRPPTLLSAEKQKELKKSLRDYSLKYKMQDREEKRTAWQNFLKKREEERNAFYALKRERLEQREKEKEARARIRPPLPDDAFEELEEEVQELEDEEVEVVERD